MAATTVVLSGIAAKRFGRRHVFHLDTCSPAEAVRALSAAFNGFRAFLAEADAKGMGFAVFRGTGEHAENVSCEQLHEPGGSTIRIAPVVRGAKNGGILNVIAGAVLIAASFIPVLAPIAPYLLSTGVALAAGGVVQMLSPQPKLQKNADNSDNQASYVFSGPVNTTAQGNPVPVVYGRMIVGSAVISAGMEADDYSPATNGVGSGTAGGSGLKTPYDTP